ncbi:PREDICTED: dnaJ homolog subfamily C member 16 isoform X2 [Ipomoea nil]|uniref:dnaJ homolog subfamily C member 16 isoform X2 n=1 Tax=Ipomoea nil TaxID=35883 RepID=UPI0009015EA3|nr:PREDICTED: dnaJ homolog subfamily C member 16 isoform X2 [Ipomoea nil]
MPAQPDSRVPPAKAPATPSTVAALKAYWLPLTLFVASLCFQLLVTPHFFPPSHYDVLGIKRYSSIEEVTKAYEKLSSKWNSGVEVASTENFIKVQYAFELLSNQTWKRDYDVFGIDEQFDLIEKVKLQHNGTSISGIRLPLMAPISFDLADNDFGIINSEGIVSMLESDKAFLVQMFSLGSGQCHQFLHKWKRIVELLDGVANTGMVELSNAQLATYLAEKKPSGQPFFRYGVPALLAFPPGCQSLKCLHRYEGELSVDAVTDWIATDILSLPRILYYWKESMGQKFLAKSKPHKVKVIFFSKTGERASPFIRQAARSYSAFADFAFVLWHEGDSSLWWNMFGVESAPALVFLKETGVQPIVYHGYINNSMFVDIMEKNKHQVLPQLRSVTSMELGCDARGFSRAGNDTKVWYCVVLAGRQSKELNEMRETMRRLQETLSNEELNKVDQDPLSTSAEVALKEKRLTFTWLDGENQKRYCFFYVNSENSYDTCGPRYDLTDAPKLFIVRYSRTAAEDEKSENLHKNSYEALFAADSDPASQLVATYNGSREIPEIVRWISVIIKDGDSNDLPSFFTGFEYI